MDATLQLSWEYIGDELAIFWLSPYGHGKEKIATFWWPAHPVEATSEVETAFEEIAKSLTQNAELQQQVKALTEERDELKAMFAPDCWFDPDDGEHAWGTPEEFAEEVGHAIGAEFYLTAAVYWKEKYRVTKLPDETSDDYECENLEGHCGKH